jgi:arabinose-5-phosphate isomerase
MGKAGIIATKIAATLSSTGSPSFFMHPADALHGDLGMVGQGDAALIFSNSGESEEIAKLLPCLRRIGSKIVGITASDRSTLAAHSDVVLLLGDIKEACPLGLAPTATTTAMLALGDAVALGLMRRKGFLEQNYAELHPAGTLGRKLMPVEDVMRFGDAVAAVLPDTKISEVVIAITKARAGAAVVIDEAGKVLGIFCDGDLRRGVEAGNDFLQQPVADAMTANCSTVRVGMLAGEVLGIMREKRIADIPVVDENGTLRGVADIKGMVASM